MLFSMPYEDFEIKPEVVKALDLIFLLHADHEQNCSTSTVRMVQECLGDAPPDLSQDVSARGLTMVGGQAQLADFAELIATNTGVEVDVALEPDTVVIRGLALCLEEMSSLYALFRDADR